MTLIEEIDEFLAEAKTLQGQPPQWFDNGRQGELAAIWNIADSAGIVRAQLRFRCSRARLGTIMLGGSPADFGKLVADDPRNPRSAIPGVAFRQPLPLRVIRSLLNTRSLHRDVRYAPLATQIVRRCNMSLRPIATDMREGGKRISFRRLASAS